MRPAYGEAVLQLELPPPVYREPLEKEEPEDTPRVLILDLNEDTESNVIQL